MFGERLDFPDEVLVYFEFWRHGGNRGIEHDCGYMAAAADRLQYRQLLPVSCELLDPQEE
ncbi:MAG: hypothetical protein GY894_10480 [Planctomycetes bacterium]|nr:hypothetical protein [Planctomycetota bacterium]MCP4839766.1 hypothetical protein [Planctomycetota bacterium]